MSNREKWFRVKCVCLFLLAMSAIAMAGEVAGQCWQTKTDRYPVVRERMARRLLAEMTMEEKVGLLFVPRFCCDGEGVTSRELRLIAHSYGLTGLVTEDWKQSVKSAESAGLRVHTDYRRSAVQALREGADVIVTSRYDRGIQQVLAAVKSGALTRERIEESAVKIVMLKMELGSVS